jgi:pimeloyl-ACP methyl ester carboxylesterase
MADPKFIDLDGVRLAYVDKGQGPLVLLLHGFPDTVRTWDRLVPALLAAGYRAVAVHMRGWPPSSEAPDGDYSIRRLAKDALGLIDALGEKTAFIVGHDWGATAACAAAIMAPAKVSAVVIEGLPPLAVYRQTLPELLHRPHHIYLRWGRLSAWWLKRRNFRLVDGLYKKWAPHFRAPTAHLDVVKTALALKGRARAAVGYYSHPMSHYDHREFTRKIKVPGLVIYGYDEPKVRRDMFRDAAKAFTRNPTIVMLKNVGHWPHLEDPRRFDQEVLSFLNSQNQR